MERNWGVFLKKRLKSAIFIFIFIILFLNTNVGAVYALEETEPQQSIQQITTGKIGIEYLYPAHLRRTVFLEGKLTAQDITYLKSIPHAKALSSLNVLRGNDGNLMLNKTAERIEGAAMLVRLLGVEEYASSKNLYHPFIDVPDWANPYIGYLYQNGLANGIGNNLYGSHHYIDEKSYLTFLLRALGYSDKNGRDFTWDTVGKAAIKAGLIKPEEDGQIGRLLKRDRLSQLSWSAMFLNNKVQNKPLLACLYDQGMINYKKLTGLLTISKNRLIDQWFALLPELETAFIRHDDKIQLSLNKEQAGDSLHKYIDYMLERIQINTGVFLQGYSTELWQQGNNYTLYFYPNYTNTVSDDKKLGLWVDEIISEIITPNMTDYEKEKAVHDYLITNLEYDSRPTSMIAESSFSALGALETGIGVCKAYSELMALILNRAGVPCRIVLGYGNETEHAWNIVCIDGEIYHVDVTWDDPVTNHKRNTIRYDYFNLTDEEINGDHFWVKDDYPACTSTSQNYFVKNNLVIDNSEILKEVIADLFESRQTRLMVRYLGEDAENFDINKIINDVNREAGYVISSYAYSLNDTTQVICLESIEYIE